MTKTQTLHQQSNIQKLLNERNAEKQKELIARDKQKAKESLLFIKLLLAKNPI